MSQKNKNMSETFKEIKRRPGTKHVHTFPEGEDFISFIEFKGRLFAGSSRSVYEVIDDELYVLKFAPMEDR